MPVPDLYVLFPEQVRDDAGTGLSEELIEELLNTWTLAWHPAILVRFQSIPRVLYADAVADHLEGSLVLCPEWLLAQRPELTETLRDRDAQVASVTQPRTHVEELFRRIDVSDAGSSSAGAAADFFALGYATLQIENLARRLQFTSHYDPAVLRDRCIVAAQAAQLGPGTALENAIHACFDALSDIRHHFYPVDIYLLDWSLLPSTLTAKQAQQVLASRVKQNLWMSGRQLQQLEPNILGILRQGLSEPRMALIGLEEDEFALPLWPANLAVSEVQRGLKISQELL
jgi:hypothetical protein